MKASFPDLKNKIVIISGVSSGIGEAQAKLFLSQGCIVYGCDKKESSINHPLFYFTSCDVSNAKQVNNFAKKVAKCHILINTAGILDDYKKTLEISEKYFDMILNTNLKSVFLMTNAFLPKMKQGVVINMASIAGLVAGGGGAAYTASKHAIIGYTKQLDYDYAPKIRANAIAPGAIETPMNAKDFLNDGLIAKQIAKEIPAKRWAKAKEVADLSIFLASDASSYIHGAVIPIDGGWIEK